MPWTLLLLVQLMTMVSQAAFHYPTWARPGRGSERREGPEPTPSEDVRGPGQSTPVPLTWSSTLGASQLVLLSLIISTLPCGPCGLKCHLFARAAIHEAGDNLIVNDR